MSRRSVVIAGLVGVPLCALAVGLYALLRTESLPAPLAEPVSPLLPDLAMSPLSELSGAVAPDGDRYLLFTASIGNVGAGPFMVHAVRAEERGDWRLSQRFAEPDGSTTETITPGEMTWAGHGHDHWHVVLGASYWLTRPGSSTILRRYEKVGYCFFDQTPLLQSVPTAPAVAQFPSTGCDTSSTMELTMGLSPGWTDPYQWTLPDQRLLVNELDDGVYRLWATADPGGWFRESNERNNLTWVDVRLTTSARPPKVAVVRQGPAGASGFQTVD